MKPRLLDLPLGGDSVTVLRDTPDTAYCSCSHLVASHRLLPATKTLPKRRGECSHADASGHCPCKGPR